LGGWDGTSLLKEKKERAIHGFVWGEIVGGQQVKKKNHNENHWDGGKGREGACSIVEGNTRLAIGRVDRQPAGGGGCPKEKQGQTEGSHGGGGGVVGTGILTEEIKQQTVKGVFSEMKLPGGLGVNRGWGSTRVRKGSKKGFGCKKGKKGGLGK